MRAPQGFARGARKEMCRQSVERPWAPTLESCPPGPLSKPLQVLAVASEKANHDRFQISLAEPAISRRFVAPK